MQNESIPDARGPVFCGVDTHADSHWLYVLDWRGRKVLSRQFPACLLYTSDAADEL